MKTKPKRSTREVVHVPQDVIFDHILPRIPAKSGCRFRCVSKEWHSFLTSDTFKNKHNHRDDHENNLKLLVLSKTKTSIEFTTIDCEAPPSDEDSTPTRRPLPPFEGITPHIIYILASFHGLVCLGIQETYVYVYSHLILWNPLTNEYKRLSKSTALMNGYIWYYRSIFGLYYSSSEDDYKLLSVQKSHHYVYIYSLKSDSWRKVDAFQHTLHPGSPSRGTYLNENLYFLQHHERYRQLPSIIRTTCIKLWKLDENDNMKEVLTCQLRPHGYDHTISSLRPFHLMKNGNWLMMLNNCLSSYNDGIYKVDLKKKMRITNKGKEKEKGNIYDDFEYAKVRMDENTNIIYLVDEEITNGEINFLAARHVLLVFWIDRDIESDIYFEFSANPKNFENETKNSKKRIGVKQMVVATLAESGMNLLDDVIESIKDKAHGAAAGGNAPVLGAPVWCLVIDLSTSTISSGPAQNPRNTPIANTTTSVIAMRGYGLWGGGDGKDNGNDDDNAGL
ncbi:putative F-box domain-containing protein [Tanacetum coccineum]